jgi:alkylhydroperoxidase family enzyme
MTYLQTPETSPLYPAEEAMYGYVPNYARTFALRPEAYAGWRALVTAVKHGMDERRYELATVAAARGVGSEYCTLAHEKILRDKFADTVPDQLDLAIIEFAGRVAADPEGIAAAEVEALREHGLTDEEILQIVLAACARRFFSGVLSATGTDPDIELTTPAVRPAAPAG